MRVTCNAITAASIVQSLALGGTRTILNESSPVSFTLSEVTTISVGGPYLHNCQATPASQRTMKIRRAFAIARANRIFSYSPVPSP